MNAALAFLDAHPLIAWLVLSSLANALIDVLGKRDTAMGRFAKKVGMDLKGVVGDKPKALLLLALVTVTHSSCSWFKSDTGATTITTPYGSVQRKGAYVPDPAPTTNVIVYCNADGGTAVDASVVDGMAADAR